MIAGSPEHVPASTSALPALAIRLGREEEVPLAVEIDDDACRLYEELGPEYCVDLPDDHPFVVEESRRWTDAARNERFFFACAPSGEPVGFSAVRWAGRRPPLDQISVRQAWMRCGVGQFLMAHALRWSAAYGELWLTTYSHAPWNRHWYEKLGFVLAPELEGNSELCAMIQHEQAALPGPANRMVMVYRHPVSLQLKEKARRVSPSRQRTGT